LISLLETNQTIGDKGTDEVSYFCYDIYGTSSECHHLESVLETI